MLNKFSQRLKVHVVGSAALGILFILFMTLALFDSPSFAAPDEGVSVDLPLSGVIEIENRHGDIRLEVWNERYVSVTAVIAGTGLARSPVSIRRTDSKLKISVIQEPNSVSSTQVNLAIRVPARSHAYLSTMRGVVRIAGFPAELSVQTVSGDISAQVSDSGDAEIVAQSASGQVTSTLTSGNERLSPGPDDRVYKIRVGLGSSKVRLQSTTGRIILAASTEEEHESRSRVEPRPPTLIGAQGIRKGAGIPAGASPGPQEVDENDVIRVDTELVTLNVSAIDRGTNRGLPDLNESDFKLYEDGTLQQIAHFESSSAPFNLVLLIDLSGSTREVVKLIRAAALHFVAAARPGDRIAVITFSNTPVVVSRLTADREALQQRISAIEQPRGSTKLYDSLAFTMDQVLKDARDSRRNAIVLMSDGLDSTLPNVSGEGSKLDYKGLLSRVREFDGVLYTLWLNTEYESLSPLDVQPETFDLGHDRMEEMADGGGGLFYEVEKLQDLAGAYERVVADLGTVYSLSYRPTNRLRDGKWRTIRVSIQRPNAVARGKRGYFAN